MEVIVVVFEVMGLVKPSGKSIQKIDPGILLLFALDC